MKASTFKKQTEVPTQDLSENSQGLNDLFISELKDMYWAEKALTKAIPKLVKQASSDELKNALNKHLSETEEQVSRLEEVFSSIDTKAQTQKCDAMDGLIKEANVIVDETEKGLIRDAGIISAAQKVEHYEIASYGTLCMFARLLDRRDAASLLEKTLEEEKEADKTLTEIAERSLKEEKLHAYAE